MILHRRQSALGTILVTRSIGGDGQSALVEAELSLDNDNEPPLVIDIPRGKFSAGERVRLVHGKGVRKLKRKEPRS
jgi:hypothetical protein